MKRTLKASWALFKIRTIEDMQYRLAALSGAVTSLVWALVEAACFTAFFEYADNAGIAGGLTLVQTVSHVWVRELLLFLQPFSIDNDLLNKIDQGGIGVELCRPLDLYWHWFSHSAAGKIVIFVMRCIPCFLVGFLMPGGFNARLPVSIGAFALFIPPAMCAFLLCMSYQMLVTAVRVNLSWGNGPMYMLLVLAQVLSGGYLPLQLWPDFMQRFLLYQPFAGICDIPARLYIGSMPLNQAWFGMAVQLFWSVIFILLGKFIMKRKLRTVTLQGG